MNILFVHPLTGNAYEVYKAFSRIRDVNIHCPFQNTKEYSLIHKVFYKLKIPLDMYGYNSYLLSKDITSYDVIFIVKGIEIFPNTLKLLKRNYPDKVIIHWSLDDMTSWKIQSIYSYLNIKYCDIIYSTKSYNLEKLSTISHKRVRLTTQGYSNDIHKSTDKSKNKIYDLLFIGRYEKERFNSLLRLALEGFRIDVFGPNWPSFTKKSHENLCIHFKSLNGMQYSEAISNSKICLGFLAKYNKDQYTSRSLEIPACNGFLLAERTEEHQKLFKEGVEAEFFSSDEELTEKVRYFIWNDIERELIISRGYKRCVDSGYSYDDITNAIINDIEVYK